MVLSCVSPVQHVGIFIYFRWNFVVISRYFFIYRTIGQSKRASYENAARFLAALNFDSVCAKDFY